MLKLLCSLTIALLSNVHLYSANQKIVMLRGSCSAGKSSFGKALEQLSPAWKYVDEDAIYVPTLVEEIKSLFPEDFALVASITEPYNCFNAIKRSEYNFLTSAQEEEKRNAQYAAQRIQATLNNKDRYPSYQAAFYQKVRSKTLDSAHTARTEHKNILIDCWLFSKEQLQELFEDTDIFEIILYTPIEQCVGNLKKRNEQALLSNHLASKRFYGQLLSSFDAFYVLTEAPTDTTIDRISATTLKNLVQALRSEVTPTDVPYEKLLFVWQEFNLQALQQWHQQLLASCTSTSTNLYIQSKQAYAFVLNTTDKTPHDVAQEFLQKIGS